MSRSIASALATVAFVVALQAQQSLAGTWEGVTPMGSSVVLDLTVKGETLEGTLTRGGETGKIVDGKVVKNSFTFRATVGSQTGAFTGELKSDEIVVWLDHLGRDNSATVLARIKS